MASEYLKQFITLSENALDAKFCDQIIAEFSGADEWQQTRVGGLAEVDRSVRNVDVIDFSSRGVMHRNESVRGAFEQKLLMATMKAVREYQTIFPDCRIVEGRGFELLRYQPGGFYRRHTDSFAREPRSLSCSFALNDDFVGGDWSFFGGEYTFSPPKGSVILFPSNFLFPHEILQISKGTRYTIVTWMI